MEISGTITEIGETKICSESFSKRIFVITYSEIEEYPQFIQLELCNKKCCLIDNFNVGDRVKVVFYFRGFKYEKEGRPKKYYLSLRAYNIEKA